MSARKPGSTRKIHKNATLKALPDEVQERLWEWLDEDKSRTYLDAVRWMQDTFQHKTNEKRLSDWRKWYAIIREGKEGSDSMKALREVLQKNGTKLDPDEINLMATNLFLARAIEEKSTKDFIALAAVVQRSQEFVQAARFHKDKMSRDDRRAMLAERDQKRREEELNLKVQEYERKIKETLRDQENPDLSAEQKHARMIARFGVTSPPTHAVITPPEGSV